MIATSRAPSRHGFLLGLPGLLYLTVFFMVPLGIVVAYSFATRSRTGRTELRDWNLEAYGRLDDDIVRTIAVRSLWIALATTLISLVLAYPLAYYMSTRTPTVRNILLVGVMLPFWSNFLVRTYAWRVLLDSDGLVSQTTQAVGIGETRVLFTPTGGVDGFGYGYLTVMVLAAPPA